MVVRSAPHTRQSSTAVDTQSTITLHGSAQIVGEFFEYSVNSILYQRGVYPPESFSRVKKYGMSMVLTEDRELQGYLQPVLNQVNAWLRRGEIRSLTLVVSSSSTGEALERWTFKVECDEALIASGQPAVKPESEITREIQAIIRQITSSVTFLPLLQDCCTFELLIDASRDCVVPTAWEESDPKFIANGTDVKLRSFSTVIHRVQPSVTYRSVDGS